MKLSLVISKLEEICRALIPLITKDGSAVDQLIGNAEDLFTNKDLLEKIREVETLLREHLDRGLSSDSIIEEIKKTNAFKEAVALSAEDIATRSQNRELQKVEEPQPNLAAARASLKMRSEGLSKNMAQTKMELVKVEREDNVFFSQFKFILSTLELVQQKLCRGNKEIVIDDELKDSLKIVKEEVRNVGIAAKLAKTSQTILLSPYWIHAYSMYPSVANRVEPIYLEYILSPGNDYRLTVANTDKEEILRLGQAKRNSLDNYRKRFVSLIKKIDKTGQDKKTVLLYPKKPLEKKILDKIADYFSNSTPRDVNKPGKYYLDALRICILDLSVKIHSGLICPLLSNREQYLYKDLCENKIVIDLASANKIPHPKVIALSLFLKKKMKDKNGLTDLFLTMHTLFETLGHALDDNCINFKNGTDLGHFKKDLAMVHELVNKFKIALKKTAKDSLHKIEEQQRTINTSFFHFFSAYSEIETALVKAIDDFGNFNEG
ncbi:MAG TPA: hypothetical protein VL832_17015 [Puia sp.]|jgi:hypothetical protein|nr:hypothetical protein [Puia sp.]